MNTYFISDHHFYHKKIIEFESRPFKNYIEMNEYMIDIHNNTVSKGEMVYFLGDFSFGNKNLTKEVFKRLNGRKFLILGNHDKARSLTWWKNIGFEQVYPNPIILEEKYIISHKPLYDLGRFCNIHGHMHNKDILSFTGEYINVCVEKLKYKPITFNNIKLL